MFISSVPWCLNGFNSLMSTWALYHLLVHLKGENDTCFSVVAVAIRVSIGANPAKMKVSKLLGFSIKIIVYHFMVVVENAMLDHEF